METQSCRDKYNEGSLDMITHEIFRFLNLRPVQKASELAIARKFVKYDRTSPLHQQIKQLSGSNARELAHELAGKVLTSAYDPSQTAVIVEIATLLSIEETVEQARKAFKTKMGLDVDTWLAGEDTSRLTDNLWDRAYAHTLLPENKSDSREPIFDAIRALHFLYSLTHLAADDKPTDLDKILKVSLLIPKEIIPLATPELKRAKQKTQIVNQLLKEWNSIKDTVDAITKAISDIKANDRLFRAKEIQARTDPKLDDMGIVTRAVDVKVLQTDDPATAFALGTVLNKSLSKEGTKAKLERSCFVLPKKSPWLFATFGEKSLRKETLGVLLSLRDDVKEKEIAEVISSLEKERYSIVKRFIDKLPKWICEYISQFTDLQRILDLLGIPTFHCKPKPPFEPPPEVDEDTAASRGIKPLGVGDLLIVKEELLRYSAGEVAHIENVLKSESKSRTTTQLREREETTVTEVEHSEETEKDLQTTDRFELQKETQKSIESEMKVDAGLSVTGSYGPVSVTAHADFALTQSSSESNKSASSYAKQTVERSVSKITQRVREEKVIRILERFEEKNEHGFDNKAGAGHVIGIYRWVDKYYKARLINYGRRLMIEFIVPEPAAFYLQIQELPIKGFTAVRPDEPKISGRALKPGDLNRWNYGDFVAAYNVQDIESYPSDTVKVSAACGEAASQGSNVDYSKAFEKLTVPNGYVVSSVYGDGWIQGYSGYFGYCTLGGQHWGSGSCNGLEGVIPLAFTGWLSAFHYNIVAVCNLKESAKAEWQLKAYQAIMNAYKRALAEYNEQVAAAQLRTGVDSDGRNPEFNRKIERDELQKGVLRLLTNNFEATRVNGTWRLNEQFNAMEANGEYGYPEFKVGEALVEGKIIQFFEQAIEWNNITYRFYPYAWGRKSEWDETFPLNDVDPKFTDFLRAGAARVLVPVHPNYTEVMLHYLGTNEIWNGGNPPTLDDPLFISIVDEIKSDSGASLDDEINACSVDSGFPCLVDEWVVKIPTSLVYLQEDAQLPDNTSDNE